MAKNILVLWVPVKGAVVTKTIVSSIQTMQGLVAGPIERVTLSARHGRAVLLHVNEEGILDGLPVNTRLTEAFGMPLLEQPLHGDGFIAAVSGSTYHDLHESEIAAWSRMLCLLQPERLHAVTASERSGS